MATDVKICMFCTYDANHRMQTAPMSANKVDDNGIFWFLSDKNSKRNEDLFEWNVTRFDIWRSVERKLHIGTWQQRSVV